MPVTRFREKFVFSGLPACLDTAPMRRPLWERRHEDAAIEVIPMRIAGCTSKAALIMLAATAWWPAQAQVLQGITGVQIEYRTPHDPAHQPIYERLKRRMVLEQYRDFLSPLRLPRPLYVAIAGCNGVINAFYTSDRRITYCYEYIAETQRQIVETNVLPGFRREDAVVGAFVSTILHETGHALFDIFNVPIFGREEDAADAIASFVALQFGPITARRIMTGTAFAWRASELAVLKGQSRRFEDYADEHGTQAQRFFNALCIALGSDLVEGATTFSDFVPLLPPTRRSHCPREYRHAKNSFATFVLPNVDHRLMKKVQETQWLRSEDGSDIAPPSGPTFGPQSTPGPLGPR
ncbi:MAG: hypothetical protein IT536_15280 [Hyphomicrobiales bacterium]|nr:hypothetical protein [Hyphomicrobiales bacterium]